jgi:hypothetical protein
MPDDIAPHRGATGRRPAKPASPRPRDPELGRLDAALAGDVDELLSGSLEDVSRVLDALFEEPAHVDPPEPVHEPRPVTEPPHPETSAVDREPTPAPASTPDSAWHPPPAGPATPDHLEHPDHPGRLGHGDEGDEHDAFDDHAAGDELAWDPLGPAPPHPLAVVLGMANAPYRMLPPTGRRVVDLLAITLLIWVPIVWTVALVLRR